MFREDLLDALKQKVKENESNKEAKNIINKIETQKRLSSKEFLQVFDAIRKDGPTTKFKTPENWE